MKVDPDMYFEGDESVMAVRYWTNGYDMYVPNVCPVWHLYNRTNVIKDKYFVENENLWESDDKRVGRELRRVKKLYGLEDNNEDLSGYELGTVRDIDAYQKFAGIDFKHLMIRKFANDGNFSGKYKPEDMIYIPRKGIKDVVVKGKNTKNVMIYCDKLDSNLNLMKFFINYGFDDIKAIICDNHTSDTYKGLKVYKFEEIEPMLVMNKSLDVDDYKIIVFYNGINDYNRIKHLLQEIGLNEFDDYLQYQLYKKKIAMTWGNCHVEVIKKFLQANPYFAMNYAFYETFELWKMIPQNVNTGIIKASDLIICQDIREDNSIGAFISSDTIDIYKSDTCKIIKVPNVYNFGRYLYPQIDIPISKDNMYFMGNKYWVWYRDKYIDDYLKKHKDYTINELLEYLYGLDLDKEIKMLYDRFITKCEKLDERSSFVINNWLKDASKSEMLFIDPEHPAEILLKKYYDEVCDILRIENVYTPMMNSINYGHGTPIYPQVLKFFDIKYDECIKYSKASESLMNTPYMNFEEYVRQYCLIYEYYNSDNNACNNQLI